MITLTLHHNYCELVFTGSNCKNNIHEDILSAALDKEDQYSREKLFLPFPVGSIPCSARRRLTGGVAIIIGLGVLTLL